MRSPLSSLSERSVMAWWHHHSQSIIIGLTVSLCLLAWRTADAAGTTASEPVACASASCAQATSDPSACTLAAPDAKAACDAYATELKHAVKRYPAASIAPTLAKDAPPEGEVEKDAPPDEAAATKTAGGVRLFPRNEQCFPTETRNIFSEVDKVVVGDDHTPRPIDWFDGHTVPPTARSAIMGQNTWMLWGEGNEAFWGWVQENGYGIADFLVLLNSKNRAHRFRDGGLINQPGMVERDTPLTGLGLYLDGPDGDKIKMHAPETDVGANGKPVERVKKPADAEHEHQTFFEVGDQALYDEAISQLGDDGVDPLVYGYPSGVVGLRLWPNPDFFGNSPAAKQAREHWNEQVVSDQGKRYYSTDPKDANFHADPLLVRPFRVSMACSFCHVGPHPLASPTDVEHPEWGNMSSMIGNQYWLPSNAFTNLKQPGSFLWQFVASQQPGTIDTSLVATDHINNPNTINAIFEMKARLARAVVNPPEAQSKSNLMLRGIEDAPLFTLDPRHTPRVLLDGADSVGIEGALLRVYLNIGAYSEQWRRVQNTIVGFAPQRPFDISTIRAKSVYWNTTEHFRVEELENFFTYATQSGATVTQPMKLASTEAGLVRINADKVDSEAGRKVFIENCAICHSSKQPPNLPITFSRDWRSAKTDGKNGITLPMDFADWNAFKLSKPWLNYVNRLEDYIGGMPNQGQDFFEKDNYLSTDVRVPITLVGTNSQRAVGTNAMRGQVWDNFSSETYKSLPAVGLVHFFNPFKKTSAVDKWGNNDEYAPPGGGPGYYRPASLVSVWATAPLLHNNALGIYNRDPSVKGRLEAYDDAIDKLLDNSKRAVTGTPEHGAAQLVNVYPAQKEAFCRDHPADPSLECSALRGDFRQSFAAAGVADQPGFRDVGFIYRTTKDSYIDFAPRFIKPLVTGVLGEGWTAFLFFYVWLALGVIALVLIFVGQPRLAGGLLALLAAVLATVLRVSGVDTIFPWLWVIPLVPLALAIAFFRFPDARGWARAFFAVSAVVFFVIGGGAKAFLEGRLVGIDIGPIPRGTPVNLIMNINPDAPTVDLLNAVAGLTRGVLLMQRDDDPKDHSFKALDEFQREAGPALLKASKCPDFVLDRGHWFGESLTSDEKRQLKAFLETL